MDLQSMITGQLKGAAMDVLSKRFGIDRAMTERVASKVLPVILGALKKNAATPQGAAELNKTVASKHDGSILEDLPGKLTDPGLEKDGSKIVGHIFGDKKDDVTREIGKTVGTDAATTQTVLSTMAPIVLGSLGKAAADKNIAGDTSAAVLRNQFVHDNEGILSTVNKLLGQKGSGNAVDDILGRLKTR